MANETIATLTNATKTYYERVLLERLQATYAHGRYAQGGKVKEIPGQAGKTIEWRRWGSLTAATTPLTEGTTPAGNNHSISVVTATPAQFGAYTVYSDALELTAIDPILEEMAAVFGEQAGDTLDQVCRDVLAAGSAIQYADSVGARGSVGIANKLNADEILLAVRTLEGANVPKIPDEFGGSYVAFVSEKSVYDLRNDPLWVATSQYAGSARIESGELGRIHGVRFIMTTNAKKFTGEGALGIDVHATIVIGKDAYGIAALSGQSMVEFYVKPVGSSGSADPLNQRGSVGWKVSEKTAILNNSRLIRIEHAVTA
jgi:N4-gp56 family major capsid protein